MKRFFLPALLPALVLLSCSNGSDASGNWYSNHQGASFSLKRTTTLYADSTVVDDEAFAYFAGPDSTGLYAGPVHLNGIPLRGGYDTSANPSFAGFAYRLGSAVDSVPLSFGGTTQHFDVGGSSKFPAFQDSIASPTELTMTAPLRTDTVTRSNGFTIAWNLPRETSSSLTLTIIPLGDSGKVGDQVITRTIPDNSRYTVAAADIKDFPVGPLWIFATRTSTATRATSDGRRYDMSVSSTYSFVTTLAP